MKSLVQILLSASLFRSAASLSMIRLIFALMAWATFTVPATGAMVAGSNPKDWPANPAKHQVVVFREAAGEKQLALITAAESAPVTKEALRKAAGELAVPEGEKVWWYKEELGIRIPCAITGDAVSYYSELVGKYGKQILNRYMEPSSRLEYHAGIKFHKEYKIDDKTFNDVNVVSLKLSFSEDFAATTTEGMHFEKVRVVVLNAEGKVLHISGDGTTEAMVIAI